MAQVIVRNKTLQNFDLPSVEKVPGNLKGGAWPGQKLVPGDNHVEKEYLERLKANEVVVKWFAKEHNTLEVVGWKDATLENLMAESKPLGEAEQKAGDEANAKAKALAEKEAAEKELLAKKEAEEAAALEASKKPEEKKLEEAWGGKKGGK